MSKIKIFISTVALFTIFFVYCPNVYAQQGCCSHHDGVRDDNCGCNDGTPFSETCAPYFEGLCKSEQESTDDKSDSDEIKEEIIENNNDNLKQINEKNDEMIGETIEDSNLIKESLNTKISLNNSSNIHDTGKVLGESTIEYSETINVKKHAETGPSINILTLLSLFFSSIFVKIKVKD